MIEAREGGIASSIRVSRVCGRLFAHSAWPTRAADSVFLGPDSYRFARFIAANLAEVAPGARVVDIGTGAGVGGIVAADVLGAAEPTLTDINARALDFARENAAAACREARFVHTAGLDGLEGPFDLALANPPFMIDPHARAYRDGGGDLGTALALDLAGQAMARLAPGRAADPVHRKPNRGGARSVRHRAGRCDSAGGVRARLCRARSRRVRRGTGPRGLRRG